MFCPNCGQERVSQATSFCSRCGFLLTGASELLATGGVMPTLTSKDSPRSRGLKPGLFMFMLMFVIAPIMGMLTVFLFRTEPWPMGIAIFALGVGGLLRMAYAMMFESKYVLGDAGGSGERDTRQSAIPGQPAAGQLTDAPFAPPVQQSRWQTSDLVPPSVTDNTTKLLEKESDNT